MTKAEAIEASATRESGVQNDLARKAFLKYGGLHSYRGTPLDYWREAFYLADEVATYAKPAPQLMEEKLALALEHTHNLLVAKTLGELRVALEAIPLTDDAASPLNIGTALGCVVKLEELTGQKGGA